MLVTPDGQLAQNKINITKGYIEQYTQKIAEAVEAGKCTQVELRQWNAAQGTQDAIEVLQQANSGLTEGHPKFIAGTAAVVLRVNIGGEIKYSVFNPQHIAGYGLEFEFGHITDALRVAKTYRQHGAEMFLVPPDVAKQADTEGALLAFGLVPGQLSQILKEPGQQPEEQ